ncbi:MAG: hypothetical protein DRQ88_04435 [Epsilonproteobacteria bacterium]|nr:MAG: hypothetical protein DRQ88_04435 [Campylobacterota bacterium]
MVARRQFIQSFLFYSLFPLDLFAKTNGKKGLYLIGASSKSDQEQNYLWGMDLDTGRQFKVPVGFRIHSIFPSQNKSEVSIVGQWEKEISRIALGQEKLLASKNIGLDKAKFVGHGFYDHQGDYLYTTAAQYSHYNKNGAGKGIILKYSLKNLEVVDQIPSYGPEPHEIFPLTGKQALVLNAGIGPEKAPISLPESNISLINYETGKLLKKWDLKEKGLFAAHGTKFNEKEFVFVGGKYLKSGDKTPMALKFPGTLKQFKLSKDLKNSPFLSVVTDASNGIAAATHPETGTLSFWDFKTGNIIKVVKLGDTLKGVSLTLNKSHFVANSTEQVFLINTKNLTLEKTIRPKNLLLNGAHSIFI